jgi:hypothetical protein
MTDLLVSKNAHTALRKLFLGMGGLRKERRKFQHFQNPGQRGWLRHGREGVDKTHLCNIIKSLN